ncbi:Uncharacterized protein Rs2_28854 [Raphanus sativus]|nr:Uncharacterized protein Rs2_28854 [Raphanus sativus]
MEVKDAMRSGAHWWTSFTRHRVQKAIRLVHSDFEAEGKIDFAPFEHLPERVPVERSPELPRKNKDIEVEEQDFPPDDSPLPGWDPSLGFGDGSGSSDAQIPNFDDFFSGLSDHPVQFPFVEETEKRPEVLAETSRVVNGAMNHFGSALVDSQRESRIWRFKAEKNANDLARLQEETLERNLRAAADHAREIRRARRQAKREIAAEMQNRATHFQEEYYNLRAAMPRLMQDGMKDNVHAESLVPPIEENIWGLWEPIPVSHDTVEVATEAEGGEDEVTYPTEFGTSSSDDFILY